MTEQEQAPSQPTTTSAPRTIEQIVALAQDYADGKPLKRVEVVAFMRDLLAMLSEPVVTMMPLAPVHEAELAARLSSLETTKSVHQTAVFDADDALRVDRALADQHFGVEPVISKTRAIFLPPAANRHYTPHEARVLAAKLISTASECQSRLST